MARPKSSTALEVAPPVSTKIKDLGWFGAGEAVFKGSIRDPGFFPPLNDMEAQREWLGGFGAAWAEAPDDTGGGESVDEALARSLEGKAELLRQLRCHASGGNSRRVH